MRPLTNDMVMLTLEPEVRLSFLPGQFVMVDLPTVGRRAYSMANVDLDRNRLDLIVKAKPGGAVSHDLCRRRRVGDRIDVEGPMAVPITATIARGR